jgi:hypothetical protein
MTRMAAEGNVDLIVKEALFPAVSNGVFLDVGAARPDYLSVSASFRQAGWRVLAIEPNPVFAALHRRLGHEIFEYAASDRNADDVDFQIVESINTHYQGGKVTYESYSPLGIPAKLAASIKTEKRSRPSRSRFGASTAFSTSTPPRSTESTSCRLT